MFAGGLVEGALRAVPPCILHELLARMVDVRAFQQPLFLTSFTPRSKPS